MCFLLLFYVGSLDCLAILPSHTYWTQLLAIAKTTYRFSSVFKGSSGVVRAHIRLKELQDPCIFSAPLLRFPVGSGERTGEVGADFGLLKMC